MVVSSASQSLAPTSLQRLPFSSAYHSPAPAILQRLPFSSASQSPAPPASPSLQRLPVSGANQSPASTGPDLAPKAASTRVSSPEYNLAWQLLVSATPPGLKQAQLSISKGEKMGIPRRLTLQSRDGDGLPWGSRSPWGYSKSKNSFSASVKSGIFGCP
jgi:hypothetical protein